MYSARKGVGVAVGVGLGVRVGVAVGLGVEVGIGLGVAPGVGATVEVDRGVGVAERVSVLDEPPVHEEIPRASAAIRQKKIDDRSIVVTDFSKRGSNMAALRSHPPNLGGAQSQT
jgi:hypothetical protein